MRSLHILLAIFGLSLSAVSPVMAQEAGLEGPGVFRWKGDGFRIETQALVHDQVRGFFTGRGFDEAGLSILVNEACLFRSSIGNAETDPNAPGITIDQNDWRIFVGGEERKLRTRSDWPPVWDRLGVDVEQRVAFKWALFPAYQEFAPNDYNWGMITFGLAPGTQFDLEIVWRQDGEKRTKRFEGMECAKQ